MRVGIKSDALRGHGRHVVTLNAPRRHIARHCLPLRNAAPTRVKAMPRGPPPPRSIPAANSHERKRAHARITACALPPSSLRMVCFPLLPLRTNKLNDQTGRVIYCLISVSHRIQGRIPRALDILCRTDNLYGPVYNPNKQAGNNKQNGRFTSSWPFISRARALPGNTEAIRPQRARERQRQRMSQVARALAYVFERAPLPYGRRRFRKSRDKVHGHGMERALVRRLAYTPPAAQYARQPTHKSHGGSGAGDRMESRVGLVRRRAAPRKRKIYLAHPLRAHLSPVARNNHAVHWTDCAVGSGYETHRVYDTPERARQRRIQRTKTALSEGACRGRTGALRSREHQRVHGVVGHPPKKIHLPPRRSSAAAALAAPSSAPAWTPHGEPRVGAVRSREHMAPRKNPQICLFTSFCVSRVTGRNGCVARMRLATGESGRVQNVEHTESLASVGKNSARPLGENVHTNDKVPRLRGGRRGCGCGYGYDLSFTVSHVGARLSRIVRYIARRAVREGSARVTRPAAAPSRAKRGLGCASPVPSREADAHESGTPAHAGSP
ncbi:hypothetical protein C8R45DRAFT_1151428 [Mycena sanguinolenta]|nr:hypothetical protein C8R45DRAFT_1151428 [Mycena sanguinolenta]